MKPPFIYFQTVKCSLQPVKHIKPSLPTAYPLLKKWIPKVAPQG